MAVKSITTGCSNNSCSDNGVLFQTMFTVNKIAKSFQMGPTKLKYLRNFGLAPFFKSLLVERLKKSAYYIVSFDKSFNITQSSEIMGEIDLLVRYFDEAELD